MLESRYDFIVCGAGASGSVVARRLAENPDVSVLLVEAGGTDDLPSIMDPGLWPTNLGSERDWSFQSVPEEQLNGRSIPLSMGKVLGGGSSINVLIWSRDHASDWNYFATEAEDPRWSFDSVTKLYQTRIEDWRGPAAAGRGKGGPVYIQPAPDPSPIAVAMVEAAASLGIPSFASHNEALLERRGGAAIMDMILREGKRHSIYQAYVQPIQGQTNLSVLKNTLITRLIVAGHTVTGIEIIHEDKLVKVEANYEVVVSLGAINTPKLLMQSGIGDEEHLAQVGVPVVQHLSGVGRNFQDHLQCSCTWEYHNPLPPRNTGGEAVLFWQSDSMLDNPDLILSQAEMPFASPENSKPGLPKNGWSLFCGIARPKSRGRIFLTSARCDEPVRIETGALTHPDDLKTLRASLDLGREIGNSPAFQPFNKREVLPGAVDEPALTTYLRNGASTFWHQCGTAKMGKDKLSVVDGSLSVYGIHNLRVADGSVLPRITTGNTMAPCVVIGEIAAAALQSTHGL